MKFVYTVLVYLYGALIWSVSPFYEKARLWVMGRRQWRQNLKVARQPHEKWIWFHCCSLGEYEDFSQVVDKIKGEFRDFKTLLSFNSPSGFEVMKNSAVADLIMYLPLDTPSNAKQFLDLLQPSFALFSRSELWVNYLTELKRRQIPIFLVSLFLNDASGFLRKPVKKFYGRCFQIFNHIFCLNPSTQEILRREFGSLPSSVTGNARIDRIFREMERLTEIKKVEEFSRNKYTVIAGSCEPKDEEIIFQVYEELKGEVQWIIVPHQVEGSIFAKLMKKNGGRSLLYSEIDDLSDAHDVLIYDRVGTLKHLYRYADYAIVGGGFRRTGIHNIIEPAQYGLEIAIGPNHRNYTEALDLMALGGAKIFTNAQELKSLIVSNLNGETESLEREISNYVKANLGASQRIASVISSQLQSLKSSLFS